MDGRLAEWNGVHRMGRRTRGSADARAARALTGQGSRQILLALVLTGAGAGAIFGTKLINNASASGGTLGGLVFEDYNANGTRDVTATVSNVSGNGSLATATDLGVAGVGVKVYSTSGALLRSTATTSSGDFQVSGLPTSGVVRVEFADLPAGFRPGPAGPDSRTAVQFVDLAGPDPSAVFGVLRPDHYCQDNPMVAASCTWLGSAVGGTSDAQAAIIGVPWASGSAALVDDSGHLAPATPPLKVRNDAIGSTWGLAYDRVGKRLFAAAYFRRHAGFGPGGPRAIYALDPTSGEVTDTFYVARAGEDMHDADLATDGGNVGFGAVGATSFGGLAMAEDASRMYVMNLASRELFAIDPTTGGEIIARQVPLSPPGCPTTGDVRPFAVTVEGQSVYVGLTCTAQSTGNPTQLRAYVYRADPGTLAFSPAPVFQTTLNYPRTNVGASSAAWRPWTATYPDLGAAGEHVYAQPLLTQIVFDRNNLVLGIRDRFADQTGIALPSDPTQAAAVTGAGAGDVLRACAAGPGTWALEDNGRCGTDGTGVQGTGAGPGGAELYVDDNAVVGGDEVTSGSLAMIPGARDFVTGVSVATPAGAARANALRWLSTSGGTYRKAYRVGDSIASAAAAPGVGGVAVLCDGAPIEIGNRVWRDDLGNGVQDAGEPGIGVVTVELWTTGPSAALVGTAITTADGSYRFNSGTTEPAVGSGDDVGGGLQPRSSFQLRIPLDGPNASALGGTFLTGKDATTASGSDASDSDAAPMGAYAAIDVTTGIGGRNNHALDAGFARPVSVGDLVWNDLNNNGLAEAGEPGIEGVTVRLLDEGGAQLNVTSTDAAGHYGFAGLAPADYRIEVVPPAGYATSTGRNGWARAAFEPGSGPNDDRDGDDNGSDVGGAVRTTAVRLTGGAEPIGDGDLDNDTNRTVDVGLFRPASIGDLVWFDNDGNGGQAPGEPGVPRVAVAVYDSRGAEVATASTNGSGRYQLGSLIPGQYSVRFSSLPSGYLFSVRGAHGAANDSDADPATGKTTVRTLVAGQADVSIDAGIYTPGDGFHPSTGESPQGGVSGTGPKRTDRAKITIRKRGPANARRGQKVTYEITVRVANTSAAPAFGVRLSERLPKGVRVSPSPRNPSPTLAGSTLTWALGDLAPGATRTVRYVVRLEAALKERLTSRAVAKARNSARVTASITTRVVRSAKGPFSIETR